VVFPVAQAVAGSTLSFIEGLSERLEKKWNWIDVARLRRDWEDERRKMLDPAARPVRPQVVAHAMRQALPRNGIMIVDAGNAAVAGRECAAEASGGRSDAGSAHAAGGA
jgi:thiamine pyrophosphate-dependent acetolactate synthase large subunit-like protein